MPATRSHLDRAVKRGEILDAAEALMLSGGYHETSMAAIARCAGVAPNAVYWYFASKDDLLAAILERRLARGTRALAESSATATLEGKVLALLEQLDQVAGLTAAVHERSVHSPALAATHEAFHVMAGGMLSEGFRDVGLEDEDAMYAAEAVMAMVDGIHLHDGQRDQALRDRLIVWSVRRLLAGSPSGVGSLV